MLGQPDTLYPVCYSFYHPQSYFCLVKRRCCSRCSTVAHRWSQLVSKAKAHLLIQASLQAENFPFQQYLSLLTAFLAPIVYFFGLVLHSACTGFPRFCRVSCVFCCSVHQAKLRLITPAPTKVVGSSATKLVHQTTLPPDRDHHTYFIYAPFNTEFRSDEMSNQINEFTTRAQSHRNINCVLFMRPLNSPPRPPRRMSHSTAHTLPHHISACDGGAWWGVIHSCAIK